MVITEIFKSIQGEGSRAGLPCIFVRLTGCNLRCTWCDTAYAFHGGTKQSIDEVIARVRELAGDAATTPDAGDGAAPVAGVGAARVAESGAGAGGSESFEAQDKTRPYGSAGARKVALVEITGGEPLLQAETPELMRRLLADGFRVMVETSGERLIGDLPREVIKIVDVKCPDSGEPDTFDMANLAAMGAEDEVKFVLSTRRDYEFARAFSAQHRLPDRVREVLFSPAFGDPAGKWPGLEPRELAEWILADGLPVRLGLQLHKFIWDPAAKGV